MIFNLLRVFLKTLTANDKYSLCNIWNLEDLIEIQLSKKAKLFSEIFAACFKDISNFRHFEKKVTLIAYVFPKLQAVKDMFRQMFK